MRTWFTVLLLSSLSIVSIVVPASASGSGTFQFLVGSGPLCQLASNACPDISMAGNSDTVSIAGQGSLSINDRSVTGSGTFTHKAPDGTVRAMGTWSALRLMTFRSFGNSPGLPSNFFGGQALILVQLSVNGTPVHTAVLTVICEIGSLPDGLHEGVKLVVQDTPFNFNKQVSGLTLFIQS